MSAEMNGDMSARVSVVVPSFNHARFLRERVESILTQTFQDFELILLDDGSTDGSAEILARYAMDEAAADGGRVRVELNERNSGNTFKQWNKGVRMARGKYVWIAESDDCAEPRLLERLVGILEERPETAYAYCRSWQLLADGRKDGYSDSLEWGRENWDWGKSFAADGAGECRRHFTVFNPVPNASAVVFRREMYERAGGADERLRICGDYKLWAALALQGRVAYLAEALNYFRWHGENVRTRANCGYSTPIEHLHAACWTLARVLEPEKVPEVVKRFGEDLPSESGLAAQLADCRAVIGAVEATLLEEDLCDRRAANRMFDQMRYALTEKEFYQREPGRLAYMRHQFLFLKYNARRMNFRQRIANVVYLISAPVLGWRNMHWIGRVSKPVRRLFAALRGGKRSHAQ